MATSIVAYPSWVGLNSFFDQPAPILGAIGIPLWVLISCFFLLLLILVNLSWLFKVRRMRAVKGYKEIQKKVGPDDVMVWLFGKTQRMIIECLRYVDSVASYHTPTMISKWHLTSPMAMLHIGGFPAMMVSDDYDQSRDPVSEIALCHACDEFNRDQKWFMEFVAQVRSAGMKLPDGVERDGIAIPINNYKDYRERGNLLLKLRYPEGVPIPAYSIFNPVKFRKYFPKGRSAGFFGGVLIRKARELKAQVKEKSFWEKVLPTAMIMVIIIVVIMAAWMAPLGR
jgi:hypothetical protein